MKHIFASMLDPMGSSLEGMNTNNNTFRVFGNLLITFVCKKIASKSEKGRSYRELFLLDGVKFLLNRIQTCGYCVFGNPSYTCFIQQSHV